MPSQYAATITEAFEDDLDTPAALRALRQLERDEAIEPGRKFETFVHADRMLGLDLARDIGRPPAEPALPERASELLEARAKARANSDWPAADLLRDELAALGVTVSDTPDGQAWTVRDK
jgi:cysteinyl-tRNA synthetase